MSSMYSAFVYLEPLTQPGSAPERGLERLDRIAADEGAERGAADHQQLDRLHQCTEMSSGQREPAEHGHHHDHVTDEDQHRARKP